MRTQTAVFLAGLLAGSFAAACGAREADPESQKRGQAEYDLALDAFKRSSMREALAHVKTSLEHDDQSADASYLGALVMLVFCADDEASPDCRYAEAEQYARKAVALDPQMRDARNTLGVILIHEKRPLEAIALLEPLTQDMVYRSPEKSWGNLGWAYLEAGRIPDAILALQRSVAAQPLFCVGHYRLGLALEKKKEYPAARHALNRALAIKEGDCERLQDALLARGRVSDALGEPDAAASDYARCAELSATTTAGRACVTASRRSP
ncbi:MAG: tetratricopeptide repeat protein [Deltaproteobacteria bacterium]|nr:tetratricopeptide repeat protein [Deltaproteobacteria bacterium]